MSDARKDLPQQQPGQQQQPTLELETTSGGWEPYNESLEATFPQKALMAELLKDPEVTQITVADAKANLESVRKRAEGWRNGVAATLALSFATLAIKKPGDGVAGFQVGWRVGMTVAIVVAIGLGVRSLWYLLRAAHGPSWLDMRAGDQGRAYDAPRYMRRAAAATAELQRGVKLWIWSVAIFAVVVVTSWYLPGISS